MIKILLLLLICKPSFAALIVKYETHPILTDQTITVRTYYDDTALNEFHTFVYSTRNPEENFYTAFSDWNTVEATHQYAVVWITNKIIEIMLANCCKTPNSTTHNRQLYELYDIEEEDEQKMSIMNTSR
jgi:hypothetical protein